MQSKMVMQIIDKIKDRLHKKTWMVACLAAALLCIILLIIAAVNGSEDNITYRETQAEKGVLTVGVTESGNVSIGTAEQTLDLDISEYTGETTFSFDSGMGGGMAGMPAATTGGSSTSTGNSGRNLEVEEVYVAAGQEIEKGTPLLKLTEESVSTLRQELSEDAADAEITYEQAQTSQKQSDLQAQADLDVNRAYGEYADSEYQLTVDELQTAVEELEEQLADTNTELAEKQAELEEMNTLMTEQNTVLANAEYARDNTSREDSLYWWIVAVNTVDDTQELLDTLQEEVESTEEEIETLTEEAASLNIQLALAQKELRTGEIEAETQRELRQFNYENAEEIYDVEISQSSYELENAKKDYEEAKQKLEEFDSMIQEDEIVSQYAGILTEVGVSAGSYLEQDDTIVTLNDYGEAVIQVTVDEEDMDSAELGSEVNISILAYSDDVLKGKVTEIGDAEINSNTNTTTYSVTVTVTGDASGLYEGMSADVTFITEESAEVIYISNRAIISQGERSYVKIKDEKGNIAKKEITTGFTDGVNTEVKEGLEEGDIVLIESSL